MYSSGRINIFSMYLHRYLRLTPSLAAAILLTTTVYRFLGNGPLWKGVSVITTDLCHDYWWSALLYVQNYVNPTKIVCKTN